MSDPFSADALRAHVESALAAIPPTQSSACVAYAKTDGTIGLSIATRMNDTWSLGAALTYDLHAKSVDGGFVIRGSW